VPGRPTATPVWQAVFWISGLLAAAAPTAVIRYRHAT
jgi:hypothetical protein